jgi:hypothetical protein
MAVKTMRQPNRRPAEKPWEGGTRHEGGRREQNVAAD